MAQTDDLRTMLRLQRELMALSPEKRRALLAELPQDPVLPSPEAPRISRAAPERRARKQRYARPRSNGIAKRNVAKKAVQTVFDAPGWMWSAEVVGAIHKVWPDAKSVNVYAALHSAAEKGKLIKEMVGIKARYCKPQGGKRPA